MGHTCNTYTFGNQNICSVISLAIYFILHENKEQEILGSWKLEKQSALYLYLAASRFRLSN